MTIKVALKRKLFWLLFIFFITACREEKAARPEKPRPPVEINAAVDKAIATTGDVITYTVTVNHSPEAEVEIPEFGAEIAGFRIEDYGADAPKQVEGRTIARRWYKLRADLIGSYILPPVKLTWRLKSKPLVRAEPGVAWAETRQIQTSQIFVEVKSVLKEGEQVQDIVDIKPLVEPKINYVFWASVIGGGLLTIAIIAGGIIYYRKRKQAGEVIIKPPAHETALAALNKLRDGGWPKSEDVKLFYFDLSEIFRAYLEDRYNFPATDWTSEEIIPWLNHNGDFAFDLKEQGKSFLLNTDRVKFAEHVPGREEIEREVERAIQFVEATKEERMKDEGGRMKEEELIN